MKKIFTLVFLLKILLVTAQPAGWLYNLPINVNNPNSQNGVDYQLKLTVNTQSLISANMMNANGSDIRFGGTCNGTINFFNYWIESGINTTSTTIWVKIPLLPANSNTLIYMFHGNTTATVASTIPGTFRGPNSSTDSVSGGSSGGSAGTQRGFRFQPNVNLLVTHFGKLEPTGTTRYVTLFDYNSTSIISQTTVAGSTTSSYTYGPISNPIWLTAGTQYVLQLFQGTGDGYYYGTSSQIGQHLTYLDMRYCNSCTQNTFPTSVLSNYHYGYPDFLYYITNTLAVTPTYTFSNSSLASVAGPSGPVCSGSTVTLTTNASGSYTWNTGATSSVIVVTASSPTNYFVTQNSVQSCVYSLVVNTSPTLSISNSSSSGTVCLGGTVTLNASGVNSHTWSGGISSGVPFSPTLTTTYTVNGTNACGTTSLATTITVAPLPVFAISNVTSVCAGSPASFTATGAASYTWIPANLYTSSITVYPATSTIYTVIGLQGSCYGGNTVALTANPLPTVSAVASNSQVCAGDAVVLTASGGLNYTWTPGNLSGTSVTVSPSTSTGYSVAGNNSFGCLAGVQIAVITNPSPTITIASSANMVCAGDLVTINASGATNYTWSAGGNTSSISVNPLTSSVYTVTGSSNNCSASQTVNVDVFIPVVSITGQTLICSGQTASLLASGANSYTWSNNIPFAGINVTPLVTTLYSVAAEATSLNVTCPGAASVLVTVNPNPTVTAVASRTSMCVNEKNTLTASGAGTYSWSSGQTSASFTIAPNLVTTFVYTVTGTDANNCSETATLTVKVNSCTGIDLLSKNGLAIYPNPNNGSFSVKSDAADMSFILMNELGQQIKQYVLSADNSYTVNINGLAKGIYFIEINRGGSGNFKIIVE